MPLLRSLVLIVILASAFLPGIGSAYTISNFVTEAEGDFIVGPAKTEIVLAPGEVKTHTITVKSRIGGQQKFRVSAQDFVASQKEGEILSFVERENISPYTLTDYLSSEINEFELGLGEQITFDVTIEVPLDAEPGGRYGAVLVTSVPEETRNEGTGITFYTEIGALLFVRIEGDLDEYGYVENFTVNDVQKGLFTRKPFTFATYFRNAGNVHLVPYGQIVISNMMGREIDAIPIDAHFALPEAVRFRSFIWPEADDRRFMIGRYTAELQMWPGYRDIPEVVRIHFWYIPIRVIIIFIIVVFLLMLTQSYLKKRYRRVDKNTNTD